HLQPFRYIPSHCHPRCHKSQVKRIITLFHVDNLGILGCRAAVVLPRREIAMRRCLVEKLACPECRGAIEVLESCEENAIRILRGTLRCTSCGQRYPIENGVPRLVKVAEDVAEVCRRFSFQWLSRWNGAFEGERCYGFDDDVYIGWVKEQLESRRVPAPGEWVLDAGCGSGEKTQVLARQSPQQNVVGLDLGVESQEKAMAKFGHMANLDYVQGNIMEPPFKDRQFDYGMSLGVLHHTN